MMISDSDMLAALTTNEGHAAVLLSLARGRRTSVASIVGEILNPVLCAMANQKFPAIYHEEMAPVFAEPAKPTPVPIYVDGVKQDFRGKKLCIWEGCAERSKVHQRCITHYAQHRASYVPNVPLVVNDEGTLIDQNFVPICIECRERMVTVPSRHLCARCNASRHYYASKQS